MRGEKFEAPEVEYSSDVLNERNETHGNFEHNSHISQTIKDLMRNQGGYRTLNDSMKESLDMIALKISRILSGKAYNKDHWVDIAGYATLVADELEDDE